MQFKGRDHQTDGETAPLCAVSKGRSPGRAGQAIEESGSVCAVC